MIWDVFEDENVFRTRGGPQNKLLNLYHLVHMVTLLSPPKDFLARSTTDKPWKYFDSEGSWKGVVEISDTSLEASEENLKGKDQV